MEKKMKKIKLDYYKFFKYFVDYKEYMAKYDNLEYDCIFKKLVPGKTYRLLKGSPLLIKIDNHYILERDFLKNLTLNQKLLYRQNPSIFYWSIRTGV